MPQRIYSRPTPPPSHTRAIALNDNQVLVVEYDEADDIITALGVWTPDEWATAWDAQVSNYVRGSAE